MQSVRRAIKRNNAVMSFDNLTKQVKTVIKRGTEKKAWNFSVKMRMPLTEEEYCNSIVKPIRVIKERSTRRSYLIKPVF